MRTNFLALIFPALLAASTLGAHADSYSFVISTSSTSTTPGTTFAVNGTFTGTPDPSVPGALELTGITGSGQGYQFTGIVPLGMFTNITYDNLLFTNLNAIHVDQEGVLLYLSSIGGTSLAHVYDMNGYHADVIDPNDPGDITPFSIENFELTPNEVVVPEASTFVLLGTGLTGFLLGIRALRKRSSLTT